MSQGTRPTRALVIMSAGLLASLIASAPDARAQSADDLAAGRRIFLQKANCQACHGWAGDGRKLDSQMPDGPNLRETPLDRDVVMTTVKCGRPGTGMPAFDRLAYSDGRCYGMKKADVQARGLEMFDPPSTLQPNEIALLLDFLFAKVIGKGPMDRAACIDYWGSDVAVCAEVGK